MINAIINASARVASSYTYDHSSTFLHVAPTEQLVLLTIETRCIISRLFTVSREKKNDGFVLR